MRHLNCFIAVAEYKSFTEAAKTLHLVQSAVSHNIAELEKELGARLFIRTKQSVSLTPQGEILLDDAYKIVSTERDAAMRVQRISRGFVGDLRMGYVFVPVVHPLMEKLKSFNKKYPEIYVKCNSYTDIVISKQLESDELDIGFTRQAIIINRDKVKWHPLYDESLKIVIHKDHPLAGCDKAKLEMFRDEPLIMMSHRFNPGLYDMSMHLYLADGFMPQIIDDINDERTVNMLVEIGNGMTILPNCWKDFVSPALKFIDIDHEDAAHTFGVAWNRTNINPCTRLFLSELGIEVPA
ncbi:MAG: LysR family transcriptional regulator [Clostridiales Family XIII bacterium]|nr:LysR family transcriptional regulator [Clostridiales Family XIII bacterium]